MRVVYYSLITSHVGTCEHQWKQSIRSLRQHNSRIAVHLFVFNGAPDSILREADRCAVEVHQLGGYAEYLDSLFVRGSLLAQYPTFSKFLGPRHSQARLASQLLYIDCDTYFFGDVEYLFERYSAFDWCAREEPTSRLSRVPRDPAHLDEALLDDMVRAQGLQPVFPFNAGLCLMNRAAWSRLNELCITYLDLAWRLLVGRQTAIPAPSGWELEIWNAVMSELTEWDRSRALPYPSSNHWIIDEIALWLSLGHIPWLSQGLLAPEDVAQGDEFEDSLRSGRRSVAAHYFNSMETAFFDAVGLIGP